MSNTKLNKNQAGDGIYTSDNLVAGSGISIQQVPQPVIDENTVELFHFNDDVVDAISGNAATTSGTFSYADGKFGKCVYNSRTGGWTAYSANSAFNSGSQSFTFDCWVKLAKEPAPSYPTCIALGGADYYYIELWTNKLRLNSRLYGLSASATLDIAINFPINSWAHVAYVHDLLTNKDYIFFNGTLLQSWTRANNYSGFKFYGCGGEMYIDEVCVSNIARWTSDFTPYTVPYATSAGPTQYAINNTKADPDLSSYLQNTATGSNSITLLGDPTSSTESINIGSISNIAGSGGAVAVGYNSVCSELGGICVGTATFVNAMDGIAIGRNSKTGGTYGIAIGGGQANAAARAPSQKAIAVGYNAQATAQSAIQLGTGTNSTANTFQVFGTTVVDANGKVPLATLPIVQLTQAEYDALDTKDANIIYAILPETSSEE